VGISSTWKRGCAASAACPLYNLMEDAATAEISRTQVWQWVHNPNGILNDGRKVTIELVREVIAEEMEQDQECHGRSALCRQQI
jgi:malate synthase